MKVVGHRISSAQSTQEQSVSILQLTAPTVSKCVSKPSTPRIANNRADWLETSHQLVTSRSALHYITLHYITLHYITLHYTALHCTALHCTALHCTALHCTALHYITLHYITLHYLTNKEASTVLCSVVKHAGSG